MAQLVGCPIRFSTYVNFFTRLLSSAVNFLNMQGLILPDGNLTIGSYHMPKSGYRFSFDMQRSKSLMGHLLIAANFEWFLTANGCGRGWEHGRKWRWTHRHDAAGGCGRWRGRRVNSARRGDWWRECEQRRIGLRRGGEHAEKLNYICISISQQSGSRRSRTSLLMSTV